MCRNLRAWSLSAAFALLPAVGLAQTFDFTLSALADDDGGSNYDALLRYTPNSYWTLSAGLGQADSSRNFSNFSGSSYSFAADLHNEHVGVRVALRNWEDSNDFAAQTLAGKLYWKRGGFEAGLLLEQRDMDVTYSFTPMGGARPLTQSAEFGGDGLGVSLSHFGERWGGYVQYLDFSYNSRLLSTVNLLNNLTPGRAPALAALAASIVTKASGVTDSEWSAGVDRAFARSGLRADVYRLRDAISRADSLGVSLSYRYSVSSRIDIEGTIGNTDSDGFEALYYGGLSFTLRN
jgi:hypothetical protein